MWFTVTFGCLCAALACSLGRQSMGQSGRAARWWAYLPIVSVAVTVVGAHSGTPQSVAFMWFTAAALVLARVDVALLRLPNLLVYPTLVLLAAWLPLAATATSRPEVALRVLAAGCVAGAGYLLLHLMSPSGLGMGDVKFAPAVAMVVGWHSWGWVLVSVFAAFALAAAWGVLLRAVRRGAAELPFGPFMVAGAGVTPLLGDQLLAWL